MADYNSIWTGAEVDEGIAKTKKITELVDVYSGAPTNAGVPLSTIPVDPDTGTRKGIYYILLSGSANPVTDAGEKSSVSILYLAGEEHIAAGSSAVGVTDTTMFSQKAKYNKTGDKAFHAYLYSHDWGTTTVTETPYYIHRILRVQLAT